MDPGLIPDFELIPIDSVLIDFPTDDDSSDTEQDSVPYPLESVTDGEDVLLVHGYRLFAGRSLLWSYECFETWGPIKLHLQFSGLNPAKKVSHIGYYKDDENCDVELPGRDDNTTYTNIK